MSSSVGVIRNPIWRNKERFNPPTLNMSENKTWLPKGFPQSESSRFTTKFRDTDITPFSDSEAPVLDGVSSTFFLEPFNHPVFEGQLMILSEKRSVSVVAEQSYIILHIILWRIQLSQHHSTSDETSGTCLDQSHHLDISCWLVVGPPLWKIWLGHLGWLATQYMGK